MGDRQDQRESAETLSILKWVDRIAGIYEAAWKSVRPPDLGDFLAEASGARRAALLEELARIDRAYREQFSQNQVRPANTPPARPETPEAYGTVPHLDAGELPGAALKPQRAPHATLSVSEGCAEVISAALRQVLSQKIAIPGYEILGEWGHGAMGVVYKARHLQLKRVAALKVIRGGAHASADQVARFRREAGAAARLQHPNIVHIYEIGEFGGLPYFAQEFMDGGSLGERLRASLLSAKAAAQLVATLAQAMQAAHEAGIIHRDLKPDNVLLTSAGICKITDFGLAKQLDDDSVTTQSDVIIGTPSYMAPEQAAGRTREIGPLSDVYALGAILYECLTGRPPFKADTTVDTLVQVRSEEPVPPRRLQPKVPRDLETICLKCLQKQPHRRYTSAQALAEDLHRFLNNEPIQARPVRSWERAAKWIRRRPAAAALVGVLLALGVAFPIATWQYYAELDRRQKDDQMRLEQAQTEVQEGHARARTAIENKDWKGADAQLRQARDKLRAEPALAHLRESIDGDLTLVKNQLEARDTYQRFFGYHDDAVYLSMQATGEDFQITLTKAREHADNALSVVRLSTETRGPCALHCP